MIGLAHTRKGMSLIEVMIAIGLLAAVATTASLYFISTRATTLDFTGATSCYELANGLTNGIKAYDNTLVVRNWLPRTTTALTSAMAARDPFCSESGGRTPVCDSFLLFRNIATTPYVEEDTHNYQNIRGAFTWAQSVYNLYRGSGICTGDGLRLDPVALRRLLPSPMEMPAWAEYFTLFIKDTALDCGDESTSMLANLELRVKPYYYPRPNRETIETCAATIALSNPSDSRPPTLTIQAVRNQRGAFIPLGGCSDRRTVEEIAFEGGVIGSDWLQVYIDLFVNEPGTILSCRKASSFEADPAARFRNCPDLPLADGATLTMTPDENDITYNTPLQARLALNNLAERAPYNEMHLYEIKATDVGNNDSLVMTTAFRVHTPTCPVDRTTYCPNAGVAPTPTPVALMSPPPMTPPPLVGPLPWEFQGQNVRPWDTCMNGPCPVGQRSNCDAGLAGSVCLGSFYNDDCGIPNCPGSMPPDSCAGVDRTVVPCGQPIIGPCGGDCGTGDLGCAPPTPRPGCDCASVDLATLACGTFAADSCGNAGLCGPGLASCPPTSIWEWGPGMLRVDESSSATTTRSTSSVFTLPSGYSTYELVLHVYGTSDRAASRITVNATISGPGGSNTFSRTAGPFYPIDRYVSFFNGVASIPASPPGNVTVDITVSVTETFSRTFFWIRAIP